MNEPGRKTMILPARQYSAVPTSAPRGLITHQWELDVERTAMIELHCWNIGVQGGMPVPEGNWVFMGSPQNHVYVDKIISGVIAPLLSMARSAGMPVVHVQPDDVANRYPELQPPLPPPPPQPPQPPVRTPWFENRNEHTPILHGAGLNDWPGWKELDVAPAVRPQPGDVMIATDDQFDDWLREQRITTLLYTGFGANLCILNSEAAMRAMRQRGYRCAIVREGTMGCEFPDTLETMDQTRAAIRIIETWVGYSVGLDDLHKAFAGVNS